MATLDLMNQRIQLLETQDRNPEQTETGTEDYQDTTQTNDTEGIIFFSLIFLKIVNNQLSIK